LKELKVRHLKRWGVLSLLRADFFYRALPWTDLILSEGRFIDDLNLKTSNRISVAFIFACLLVLLGSWWVPWLFLIAVFLMTVLFAINQDLYRFFREKRGLSFAAKTIPWHGFYFLYGGLAFSIGFTKSKVRRLGS